MTEKKSKEKELIYKGKPLVRSGSTIYYGDMADKYVAMLQIFETEPFKDMQLPQRVSVQILSTDATLRPKERIKKKTDKANLYEALDIAAIWLHRMLEQ